MGYQWMLSLHKGSLVEYKTEAAPSALPAKVGTLSTEQTFFNEFVFEKLRNWRQAGIKTALLTLVNIEGASPRPMGSQLAVNEQGEFAGLISGGCLELALVAEAQICMQQAVTKCVRYGRNSDYFDIQLPCGSGVDILIQPISSDDSWPEYICNLYHARKPFIWRYDSTKQTNTIAMMGAEDTHTSNKHYTREQMDSEFTLFQKPFFPRHRIAVVGEGEVFNFFVQLSQSFDFNVLAYSNKKPKTGRYLQIESWDSSILDRWTSLIILSHDHSWEQAILLQALATDVSFISALGSKNTHSKRLQSLLDCGADKHRLQSIKGPAGLDIGSCNPPEIALSILSEVVAQKNHKL